MILMSTIARANLFIELLLKEEIENSLSTYIIVVLLQPL